MAQFPNEINPLVVPFPAVDTLSPLVVLFPTAAPVNPTLVSPLEVGLMTSADVVVLVNAKLLLLPLLLGVTIHSLEELGVNVMFALTLEPSGTVLPINAFPSE